jgi:hypothetical protein
VSFVIPMFVPECVGVGREDEKTRTHKTKKRLVSNCFIFGAFCNLLGKFKVLLCSSPPVEQYSSSRCCVVG